MPIYLVVLVPYAVVEGDCNYVNTHKVWAGLGQTFEAIWLLCRSGRVPDNFWQEHFWAAAARRRATKLDMVALPIITTETTRAPKIQVILVFLVGLAMLW